MAKKRRRTALRNWAEYLTVRGLVGFAQCFSVEQNLSTATSLGRFYHGRSESRRARTEQNVRWAFPEKSDAEIARIAERSVEHMLRVFMVDALATPRLITPNSWTRYIQTGPLMGVLERMIRREPMILVTGHMGNWELLGYFLSMIGLPVSAIARPLDNPLLNDWFLGVRESRGMRIITKWGATPELQATIRQRGRLGFIADQNAGDQGMFVPFFGRLASSYKSIGLLAMRYKVPVAAGVAIRTDDHSLSYRVEVVDVINPEDWVDRDDPLFYITARYTRALETMVRLAPDQYLWVHRRWKSRPKHERLGKPMPRVLRRRLESLPWMTDDLMHRLNHPEPAI